jgi:hypothetical protein
VVTDGAEASNGHQNARKYTKVTHRPHQPPTLPGTMPAVGTLRASAEVGLLLLIVEIIFAPDELRIQRKAINVLVLC